MELNCFSILSVHRRIVWGGAERDSFESICEVEQNGAFLLEIDVWNLQAPTRRCFQDVSKAYQARGLVAITMWST